MELYRDKGDLRQFEKVVERSSEALKLLKKKYKQLERNGGTK